MWHDIKKTKKWWMFFLLLLTAAVVYIVINEQKTDVEGKVIVCIPTYGQSLALGEEAERITDFDTFTVETHNRVVTENIDDKFGYFDGSAFKQYVKKLCHYRKRSFELSLYGMSESLLQQLGTDTVLCIFPGGQGATVLSKLVKGSTPYKRFLADIEQACRIAVREGAAKFYVPAICWLQGESDIADYPGTDYKELFMQFCHDINQDVKAITHQSEDVRLICYQTNILTRADHFSAAHFETPEMAVPQTMVDLLRSDTLLWASGPVYQYPYVREAIHIDGPSQKHLGHLEARSALGILRGSERFAGLLPQSYTVSDSAVVIRFMVPCPPLVFDTVQVRKAAHYGFSVVRPDGTDITSHVEAGDSTVRIVCSQSPAGCRVRYAVNGEAGKSGCQNGPRGNLRDSQGNACSATIAGQTVPLHNWCFQFDEALQN